MSGPRVLLELVAVVGERWAEVTPDVRVRRLLKAARRAYGLRCVAVTRLDDMEGRDAARPSDRAVPCRKSTSKAP